MRGYICIKQKKLWWWGKWPLGWKNEKWRFREKKIKRGKEKGEKIGNARNAQYIPLPKCIFNMNYSGALKTRISKHTSPPTCDISKPNNEIFALIRIGLQEGREGIFVYSHSFQTEPISLHMCARLKALPSNISTMPARMVVNQAWDES